MSCARAEVWMVGSTFSIRYETMSGLLQQSVTDKWVGG